MSDNNVVENVPDPVVEEEGLDVVDTPSPAEREREENKSEMPPKKKTPPPPVITNPEPVENTPKVNKKLSAMSKNTKEKQKNRKLSKPTVSRAGPTKTSLDINPMYLFGLLGVIIAAASLWYQRKSFLEEQKDDSDKDQSPVQSTGETTTPKKFHKTSEDNRGAKPSFDPWEWKREHSKGGVLPQAFDFD